MSELKSESSNPSHPQSMAIAILKLPSLLAYSAVCQRISTKSTACMATSMFYCLVTLVLQSLSFSSMSRRQYIMQSLPQVRVPVPLVLWLASRKILLHMNGLSKVELLCLLTRGPGAIFFQCQRVGGITSQ